MQRNKVSAICRFNFILPLFMFFITSPSFFVSGQEVTDSIVHGGLICNEAARQDALAAILPNYNEWETAEISGKLRMKSLPLSPTVKISMKKSEEISISVRASFLGEVGRIEISGDSVIAVNKMKHVYCAESISGIKYDYPDIISDIQSILLGRAVVLRAGELSESTAELLDFARIIENTDSLQNYAENGADMAWSLTFPKGRTESDEFGYTYRINDAGLVENLLVELSSADHELALDLAYYYSGKGYDLNITFNQDYKQKFDATIEFWETKWETSMPDPINLNSRYNRVGIKQFLRSF